MLLELTNVNKYFGGLQVLSDISFNVDKGEIVGLLGPNGAGKTTIFNVCDRIIVLDYGKKLAEGGPKEIARNKKVMEAYLGEPSA